MAVVLTIVLTFFGAAACYGDSLHMRVRFFVGLMPPVVQWVCGMLSELLVAAVALFMVKYGWGLRVASVNPSIDTFPELSLGATLLPSTIRGAPRLLLSH